MWYVTRISAFILLIYAVGIAGVYAFQRDLQYYPSHVRAKPVALGLNSVHEQLFKTPDGERLVAWYAPPRPGFPTILYYHGNAGGLTDRAPRVRLYVKRGYGVLLYGHRGFAGSTGSPNESTLVSDAVRIFDYLTEHGTRASDIVIYGESLGTAVAVQVAAQRRARAVILESPFTSAVDVGKYTYPYLPVRWLLEDRYESIRYVSHIRSPILVLHGMQDRIVPIEFGRRLYKAIVAPKVGYFLPGANHYTIYEHGGWPLIEAFLQALPSRMAHSGVGRAHITSRR